MTTTTKIFVVLVCLFAFILTPLAIQFAALTNQWQEVALESADKVDSAYAAQRNAVSVMHAETAHGRELLTKAYSQVNELEDTVAQLQESKAELAEDFAITKQNADANQATVHRAVAELALLNKLNQELLDEREELVDTAQKAQARSNELAERVTELNTRIVVLKEQNYQLEETVNYLSQENERLRKEFQLGPVGEVMTSTPGAQVKAETPAAWPGIRGEVTEVRGDKATINVGSNSGLRPGMKLVAFRGDELVCDLIVTDNVAPDEAVTKMQLIGGKRLQEGDKVIDEASLYKR